MATLISDTTLRIIVEAMMKSIGVSDDCYDQLLEYKNKKALINKKSKYSFSDAIKDLIKDSKVLAEWMKGKR